MSLHLLFKRQIATAVMLGCVFTAIAQSEEKESPAYFPGMNGFKLTNVIEKNSDDAEVRKKDRKAEPESTNYVYTFSGKKKVKAPTSRQLSEHYASALQKAPGRKSGAQKNISSNSRFAGGYIHNGKEVWINISDYVFDRDSSVIGYTLQYLEHPEAGYINAASMVDILKSEGKIELDIHFEANKATVLEESIAQVYELVTTLRNDPFLKVSIEAHTDKMGSAAQNKELSEARANAVKDMLIRKGIDPLRLTSIGWGWSKPVADNSTELGRAKNRRIEIIKK